MLPSSIKKLEKAVFSTNSQEILSKIQEDINNLEIDLSESIKSKNSDIIKFCFSLNEVSDALNNLIKINNWTNNHFQENYKQLKYEIENLENILEVEKNLNDFTRILRNIVIFKEEIEKIENEKNIFNVVTAIQKLESSVFHFKGYNFYHRFQNEYKKLESNILKNTKKDAIKWIEFVNSLYEAFGANFLSRIRQKNSIIFDIRYSSYEDAQVFKIYDWLYLFSALRSSKDLIDKMNIKRESLSLELTTDSLNTTLYKFVGFFIVEFYLIEIDILFDLKESYLKITDQMIENIQNMEKDPLEQKIYFLAFRNTLQKFKFDVRKLDDTILQLFIIFFQEKQQNMNSYTDIYDYIKEIEKIMPNIDNPDIKLLFYKNIDDALLNFFENSNEYFKIVFDIQNKFPNFNFRSYQKSNIFLKKNLENTKNEFIKKFDQIITENNFEKFNQKLESEIQIFSDFLKDQKEKKKLIFEIKNYCINKLKNFEKMNPKDKNFNAKRAIFTKIFVFEDE